MNEEELIAHKGRDHEGRPTFALYDARRIYVARVCDECEETVRAGSRPEIFENPSYEADEPIEED